MKTGYTDSQCGGWGRSHESQVPFRGSLNPRTLPDLNLKLHPLADLFQNVDIIPSCHLIVVVWSQVDEKVVAVDLELFPDHAVGLQLFVEEPHVLLEPVESCAVRCSRCGEKMFVENLGRPDRGHGRRGCREAVAGREEDQLPGQVLE